MSPHVLVGVPRPAWQIKNAAVRHSGHHKAARAPPLVGPLANARIKQHPFPISGDQAHVNENTRHKTLAAATEHVWDAFVIVVGMLKGGTGKTTSAWFIALYYAIVLGLPTLLLDADATSQSAYDWFKVAQAAGFEIPANLVVERYPFDDIAEYIRTKRAEFGAIVVDAGGGSARIFHEAVTEANLLLVPVAPTKIERRKLVATFDEAERAAARNEHGVTAHVVMVKADDRTSLPGRAKQQLLEPAEGEGIGPDRDEPFPLADTTIHSWVHYMEAFGEIPTELSEYANLMKELTEA
ncbi:chromosome partitioning protein [Streptomyces sp. yr375]|nr:chromosome partitioning protein [Streptomyces sp. yr375]